MSPRPANRNLVCARCGLRFKAASAKSYCSPECSRLGRSAPFSPLRIAPCLECGRPFVRRTRERLCSADCRVSRVASYDRQRYNANRRAAYMPKPPKTYRCVLCKDTFEAKGRRKYCGASCRQAVMIERNHPNVMRRNALYRAAPDLSRVAIFERDRWCCQLCLRAVDPEIMWPDPWSASLDHILPISRGGEHTPSNVQLAHLRCNISKRDRSSPTPPIF